MNALGDKHVQYWVMASLLCVSLMGGAFVGTWVSRDTVVYDYTFELAGGERGTMPLQYGVWPELANTDFYRSVRDTFIDEKAHFIEANLTTMRLSVYRSGKEVLEVPIKSKGREGSWWETPAGLYKAEAKKEKHFSSFGRVYMPYNIPFQGNFFIHGWPYYPDGTPVAEGYSGGCIRLGDEEAKAVYELTDVGMPILVFEEEDPTESAAETYVLSTPSLTGASYLVADLANHFVLLAGSEQVERHTRILGRMMAALVVAEHMNIEQSITIAPSMLSTGTSSQLVAGQSYRIYDLLFPLLLEGSPDVARAFEETYGKGYFVSLMNKKAQAIGMRDTRFADVTGTSPQNETTAQDVFLFLKYLLNNRSFVLDISAGKDNAVVYGSTAAGFATSTHPLFFDAGFVGGMADLTETSELAQSDAMNDVAAVMLVFASSSEPVTISSGDMVTVIERVFNGIRRRLAVVVLDSDRPTHDTKKMLDHVERLYR